MGSEETRRGMSIMKSPKEHFAYLFWITQTSNLKRLIYLLNLKHQYGFTFCGKAVSACFVPHRPSVLTPVAAISAPATYVHLH
jgi:hypothetical protein